MPIFTKRAKRRPGLRWNTTPPGRFLYRVLPLGQDEWVDEALQPGARMLADYYGAQHGGVQFQPAFDCRLVSYNENSIETPDDLGEDGKPRYNYCVVLPVFVPELHGVFEIMTTGAFMTGVITDLIDLVASDPHTAEGLIPVVEWTENAERRPKSGPAKNKVFEIPKLAIVNWGPRPDFFGPATMPRPKPLLALGCDVSVAVDMAAIGKDGVVEVTKVAAARSARDDLNDEIPF
jgi:hypothetical protein